tara:strand:+ start:566 stop:1324 length:759 start_codon:yes stop_codon:yes gene_type:complete
MLFINLIQTNLQTSIIGKNIEYFPFTDSTNDDALDLILKNKAEDGMVIITDHQKKGRGRRGNQWFSSPGNNLTFSLVLKKYQQSKSSLIAILSGVAIVRGIKKFSNIECQLKWPNDIMLNDKKIGGILIETKKINELIYLVIGIGLNVNEQEIPSDLSNIASSLRIEDSKPVQREPLLAFILNEFEQLHQSDSDEWISYWKKYCNHMNKKIKFHDNDDIIQGEFAGIDSDGSALLNINSKQVKISSGVLEEL